MASGGKAHRFPDAWYEGAPAWVLEARKDVGIREKLRSGKSNPAVLGYFAAVGHSWVKDCIGTPWCAAWFGAKVAAGGMVTTRNLMARSYLKWGTPRKGAPKIGDAAVFWRGKRDDGISGHIGIFIRRDAKFVYVLSGNSGDSVSEEAIAVRKLLEFRKPPSLIARAGSPAGSLPERAELRPERASAGAGATAVAKTPVKVEQQDVPAAPAPPPLRQVTDGTPAAAPALAWQTTVVRDLAPVSRKVSLLARVRLFFVSLFTTISGLFTLDSLGVAREWIESLKALADGNGTLILVAGAAAGAVIASYLLSCIADDYDKGKYTPSAPASSGDAAPAA